MPVKHGADWAKLHGNTGTIYPLSTKHLRNILCFPQEGHNEQTIFVGHNIAIEYFIKT